MDDGEARGLTHVDSRGEARMVDVGGKPVSAREARACGTVRAAPETVRLIAENRAAKGDVLAVARIAGIMAAKRTDELIPLCHSLPLSGVSVEFTLHPESGKVDIEASARTESRTGVEMEALTAVAVAALTIYDMCKAVDREMTIGEIRLLYKSGGRSGTFVRSAD